MANGVRGAPFSGGETAAANGRAHEINPESLQLFIMPALIGQRSRRHCLEPLLRSPSANTVIDCLLFVIECNVAERLIDVLNYGLVFITIIYIIRDLLYVF